MNTFNTEQCEVAIAEWINCCGNYTAIQNLIPTNYVFNFDAAQIGWLKLRNKYSSFCAEIGIYEDQLVAILYPLDAAGQKVAAEEYPYSFLKELEQDLVLVETAVYTLIKNAVLSRDLRKIDNNSDMNFPVSNAPMMEQDQAVAAIESWRNDGMTWFYRECDEFAGNRIFKKFYVPAEDLTLSKPGLTNIICSFGMKFSEVYQRVLPTLIFISFYVDIENTGSIEKVSNTYDWSQPCPPICNI
ncbi:MULTISPECIES: hypothetical protein [Chryseobacterium]|uniref:Uncharacterized protein n=1 Tax=Chryseobacterium geocarposphaerae TaxID=1416776 RepID=A0ABU1LD68_9FLAO|nr:MULTISPECIES: hypothetical protein [Chryseobacterium]ALR32581.1 hypothetical protein ATE47_11795 [Chryseobacterium sp. IHB B 17019]MDR6404663.1 hypothetical protein [Chryseobacterium geocarposphaerae]MDR6698104.1 hypothetical protein [Chryseobacterium ginsenosidimutans]